jgi:RecA/RadA recombinase
LSAQKIRRLSLGVSVLDDIFPGFETGNFAVLHGDSASFISFLLCVRAQLPHEKGGLGSSAVFVDGGNSFSPYIVAELARSYSLDSRATLENIYVSRAFTAYQLSSLILEKLEPFLKSKKAKLLIVSDISSLFFDKDIPKTEAFLGQLLHLSASCVIGESEFLPFLEA